MPVYRQLLKDISASQDHVCLTCITVVLNVNKSKLRSVHKVIHLGLVLGMTSRGKGYFSPKCQQETDLNDTPCYFSTGNTKKAYYKS